MFTILAFSEATGSMVGLINPFSKFRGFFLHFFFIEFLEFGSNSSSDYFATHEGSEK